MASSKDNSQPETPHLTFDPSVSSTSATPGQSTSNDSAPLDNASRLHRRLRGYSLKARQAPKHVRLEELHGGSKSTASSIYKGSFGRSPRRSIASRHGSVKTPTGSIRSSLNAAQLENLLTNLHMDLETYGVEELRDGFFDASFFKPSKTTSEVLMRDAEETLPEVFQKQLPLSLSNFLSNNEWHDVQNIVQSVMTTRAGIKLLKSFSAFFIAYILCLIPSIRSWLGRYNYIMVLSTVINHPGRTIGAQIDGAILTIIGTVAGLGWGSFALWVSDCTAVARSGYGGILAAFLIAFMGPVSALRSYYIRLYQLVLCAGIAITYTCLAETSEKVAWSKLFDYGIPWVLGQGLCLLVCCTVFPDAGSRQLAVALHDAFDVMQQSLTLPQLDDVVTHRKLAFTFVNLSQALRDLVLDCSLTRFLPSDVYDLRNLMQAVVRSLLSLKMETHPFKDIEERRETNSSNSKSTSSAILSPTNPHIHIDAVIDIDPPEVGQRTKRPSIQRTDTEERAVQLVVDKMADPTSNLLSCIKTSIERCDTVLMSMSGYRKYIGPPKDVSSDILGALTKIRKVMIKYDAEEEALLHHPELPPTYSNHPEVVELFLFSHPIRQAATSTENLLVKIMAMQQKRRGLRLYLPSYPFPKALQRTNAQVRHDRGGVTAGHYFQSQSELAQTLAGMANIYKPLPRQTDNPEIVNVRRTDTIGKYEEEGEEAINPRSHASTQKRVRYRIWKVLHRLQGFETRFGLKGAIVTSLLSVPAWLDQSRGWWNKYEACWAVVMVWVMMHPRVGGNFQDLMTRALCAILGTVWGGIAYGARNGNPYVMAAFATIYMLPMMYRFTQSPHPRSGLVGCISFVVVSLGARTADDLPSVVGIAWTRGVAFVVGVVAAVVINWVLWPFVARHELRKALSAMMIYCSIIYRGVVAKYVYFDEDHVPGEKDIERSEMLEGRLREGFVRIRQLMALTRHEIRLRAPFSPLPYSALITSLERFFEYLIEIRQSSVFFHPHYLSDNKQASEGLLSFRRDAVAAILMNLYILAGALRTGRRVPKYLPNAAAARKRLLDHMAIVEAEQHATSNKPSSSPNDHNHKSKLDGGEELLGKEKEEEGEASDVREGKEAQGEDYQGRKWSEIYSYSYSQSLTGCVQQLVQLQKYTKEIVGEQGFNITDGHYDDDFEDFMASGMRTGLRSRSRSRVRSRRNSRSRSRSRTRPMD